MTKGTTMRLEVTDVANTGHGIAHLEGKTVFIQHAVRGDVVKAEVIKDTKTYAVARICELLTPSPERIEKDCSAYPVCGGCVFRHLSYACELDLKRGFVRDAFRKCGMQVEPAETVFGTEYGYRNKVQYPADFDTDRGLYFGFFSERTHRTVHIPECRIEHPAFASVRAEAEKLLNSFHASAYNEQTGHGEIRHLFLRASGAGKVMACLVGNAPSLPYEKEFAEGLRACCPPVISVYYNVNLEKTNVILGKETRLMAGQAALEDELCGLVFSVSPQSFYQVNREMTEKLYRGAAKVLQLKKQEVLLDLYCGIGSVGLCVASPENRLFGVEIVPEAVENARQNALRNGREANSRFLCADAEDGLSACRAAFGRIDAVIVDPPRKGVTAEVIAQIASEKVGKVCYISCNPQTLARDVMLFSEKGYVLKSLTPYDLFPRTAHVESVALLEKE